MNITEMLGWDQGTGSSDNALWSDRIICDVYYYKSN